MKGLHMNSRELCMSLTHLIADQQVCTAGQSSRMLPHGLIAGHENQLVLAQSEVVHLWQWQAHYMVMLSGG